MTNAGCVRCNGELEPGFLVDHADFGAVRQAMWASGDAKPVSILRNSIVPDGSDLIAVVTYRCVDCGRLESFAH